MSRKSSQTCGKALDLWQPPANAGEPLVCLATTFTFDATFFEIECLGRFLMMDTHPSESEAVGYLIEREEKLASTRICVLVDRRHAREKESLRWDVVPVLVPRASQHAKLAVLCWANHIRIIVGSGNLTEPAYRKNLEVFGTLELCRTAGGPVRKIHECLEFLDRVVDRAIGREARPGPRRRARVAVDAIRRHMHQWPEAESDNSSPYPVFCGIGRSVLEQLKELWPASSPPRCAWVVSPFFDAGADQVHAVRSLIEILAKKRPRGMYFDVPFENLPDGRTRMCAPLQMIKEAEASCDVTVQKIAGEQRGEPRELHAKILAIANDDWVIHLAGSSNFTIAGLGIRPTAANLEANLAYRLRRTQDECDILEEVWPDTDGDVDIRDQNLVWDPVFAEEGEEGLVPLLPAAFEEALFEAGREPRLLISLGEHLPPKWSIRVPGAMPILTSDAWGQERGEYVADWHDKAIPLVLEVNWYSQSEERTASWPVNVVDPSALPPPEALRNLTLAELIEVLASTRPMHAAVTQVLTKRMIRGQNEFQLDPHKRINTETFLLMRAKRVAAALERLRERLERPVLTSEALQWRLYGPVGPMALAEAFIREASLPGEELFFLAELALALRRVRAEKAAQGGLPEEAIRQCIAELIERIEQMALSNPIETEAAALNAYVAEAFREARR